MICRSKKVLIPELSELARKLASGSDYAHAVATARVVGRRRGTMIRCDMYRHVARCHLELAQLWRCPISWCTVWKGVPQDLMDHVRGSHKVPEEVQHIKLETLIPPWTVTRQVYMDSLTSRHSGISNDILLFSDIGLSLTHHYRVHRRNVPHVAFRRNYMSQLRALLPLPAVPLTEGRSPDLGSLSVEESRRTFARRRLTQIRETPRRIAPRLTEQDTLAVAGSMVFDCRPQVLPGAMDVSGWEWSEILKTHCSSGSRHDAPSVGPLSRDTPRAERSW